MGDRDHRVLYTITGMGAGPTGYRPQRPVAAFYGVLAPSKTALEGFRAGFFHFAPFAREKGIGRAGQFSFFFFYPFIPI